MEEPPPCRSLDGVPLIHAALSHRSPAHPETPHTLVQRGKSHPAAVCRPRGEQWKPLWLLADKSPGLWGVACFLQGDQQRGPQCSQLPAVGPLLKVAGQGDSLGERSTPSAPTAQRWDLGPACSRL